MIKVISFDDTISENAEQIKAEIDRILSGNIWRLVAVTTSTIKHGDRHHYHFHRVTPTKS